MRWISLSDSDFVVHLKTHNAIFPLIPLPDIGPPIPMLTSTGSGCCGRSSPPSAQRAWTTCRHKNSKIKDCGTSWICSVHIGHVALAFRNMLVSSNCSLYYMADSWGRSRYFGLSEVVVTSPTSPHAIWSGNLPVRRSGDESPARFWSVPPWGQVFPIHSWFAGWRV